MSVSPDSRSPDSASRPTAQGGGLALLDGGWAADALRTVWARQQGRIRERIATIERAGAALATGALDESLRDGARRAAHMLAGTLGIFGFLDASRAAGEIESRLQEDEERLREDRERLAPELARALGGLLARVRADVRRPLTPPPVHVGERLMPPPAPAARALARPPE